MEAWGFYTGRFEFNGRQVAPGKASSIKTKQNSLGLKSVKTRRESILIERKKRLQPVSFSRQFRGGAVLDGLDVNRLIYLRQRCLSFRAAQWLHISSIFGNLALELAKMVKVGAPGEFETDLRNKRVTSRRL